MTGYTHWAYFKNYEQATACKANLPDYVVRIEGPTDYRTDWLLRAGHDAPEGFPKGWSDEIESIVSRHGGEYDGGEMTFQVTGTGWISVPDPDLTQVSTGLPEDDEHLKDVEALLGDLYVDPTVNTRKEKGV